MPFSHIGLNASSSTFDRVLDFYLRSLAPLGYAEIMRPVPWVVGMGPNGKPELWLAKTDDDNDDGHNTTTTKLHLALEASSREVVQKFYDEALKAGGLCNGCPGLRPQYMPSYYAAFVLDPLGNNLEVVCCRPE